MTVKKSTVAVGGFSVGLRGTGNSENGSCLVSQLLNFLFIVIVGDFNAVLWANFGFKVLFTVPTIGYLCTVVMKPEMRSTDRGKFLSPAFSPGQVIILNYRCTD